MKAPDSIWEISAKVVQLTVSDSPSMPGRLPMTTDQLPANALPRLKVGGEFEVVTELPYVADDLIKAAENLRIPAEFGGHYVYDVTAETTTAGVAAPHSPGFQVMPGGVPVPPDLPVSRVIMTKRLKP